MAVDLSDLIPNLKAQINSPGTDAYASTTNNEWLTRLENAFWEVRLDGLFTNFVAADGEITPIAPETADLSRDALQLVILYAAMDVVMAQFRSVQSAFKAVAGPVSYETQQSAQLLREVLVTLRQRIKDVVYNLASIYYIRTAVLDAVIERTDALIDGDNWWIR
jgi:hypothetical protein